MLKKIYRKTRLYCPPAAMILFAVAIIAAAVHLASAQSAAFSDFFNGNISPPVRALLAHVTGFLPFSLSEAAIMFVPVILALLVVYCLKISRGTKYTAARYITSLFAAASLFYSLFVFGFATAYGATKLEEKLGLERSDVTAEELYDTARVLLDRIEELTDDVSFKYASFSVMPYSLDEMTDKLNAAYGRTCDKYPFAQRLDARLKYVLLSEPMTYTHISGVYTFYTGEANLNINFPDYTLPFTAAHEMSHQRGIAREDEANFMAFLVCLESDDGYIRYSAYMNMFEYVVGALYRADPSLYYDIIASMDNRARYEMIAYSEFFDKYRDSAASTVSGAINDAYLKSQGQSAGSKSYGMVVDLAVAYYKR